MPSIQEAEDKVAVEPAVAELLEHFAHVIRLNNGVNARSDLVSGPGCSGAGRDSKGPGQVAGRYDETTSMRTRSLASARVAGRSWIAGEPLESNSGAGSGDPISPANGSPFGSRDREGDPSAADFLLVTRCHLDAWQDRADRMMSRWAIDRFGDNARRAAVICADCNELITECSSQSVAVTSMGSPVPRLWGGLVGGPCPAASAGVAGGGSPGRYARLRSRDAAWRRVARLVARRAGYSSTTSADRKIAHGKWVRGSRPGPGAVIGPGQGR
jgi:hypothetical protein